MKENLKRKETRKNISLADELRWNAQLKAEELADTWAFDEYTASINTLRACGYGRVSAEALCGAAY